MQFSSVLSDNISHLHSLLDVGTNFDVVYRTARVGGRDACLYFVDGFTKDEVLLKILQAWSSIKPEAMPSDVHEFSKQYVPYGEVDLLDTEDSVITLLLSGITCVFIDGYDRCLAIDCRTYPARGVSEPEKDKVMRGSRDGFVETLIFNTALIRRRIRDPKLTMEIMTMGESSHTDIAICYMKGRVDEQMLTQIKKRMNSIHVDALTMNQESLAECLYPHKWYNPFPKFKFSERPDTAAASILEGNIIILVDNSPAAMILPSSVFDIIEEADDYYFPPLVGSYLRVLRLFIFLATLYLTPIWYLLTRYPDTIPASLSFIRIEEIPQFPVLAQLFLVEIVVDGLKMASLNTPSTLSNSLSVVGGLILGDFAVQVGWLIPEVIVYMAFVSIANFSQASYELGYALKFMRMGLLLLSGIGGWWGFAVGVVLIPVIVATNRTVTGKRGYLYPVIPFNGRALVRLLFRVRLKTGDR